MAGGLQEVRDRISSVQNTMQITSAMKMVSAAKLRRAQHAITQMRPYAVKLQGMLANVSASLDKGEGLYSEEREVKRVLIVAITSNRGLCGAFNNNVVKMASRLAAECRESNQAFDVLPLGKKAVDAAKRLEWSLAEGFGDASTTLFDNLNFGQASEVANEVMAQFVAGKYDKVVLAYNQFKNAAVQLPTEEGFLPMLPSEDTSADASAVDYINAHGTSTMADVIELAAVERLMGDAAGKVTMSSTKSATGHLLGAAGAIEAIFSILAIRDQVAPPTINLDNPAVETPVDLAPNKKREREIKVALSNSFGFGGTNACVAFGKID